MILCKTVVIFLSLLRHTTIKYHDYGSLFVNQSPFLYVTSAVIYSNITTSKHTLSSCDSRNKNCALFSYFCGSNSPLLKILFKNLLGEEYKLLIFLFYIFFPSTPSTNLSSEYNPNELFSSF